MATLEGLKHVGEFHVISHSNLKDLPPLETGLQDFRVRLSEDTGLETLVPSCDIICQGQRVREFHGDLTRGVTIVAAQHWMNLDSHRGNAGVRTVESDYGLN